MKTAMYPPLEPGHQWYGGLPCTWCGQLVAEQARVLWSTRDDTDRPMPAVVLCTDVCESASRVATPADTPWRSMGLAEYLAHLAMSARLETETIEELERLEMAKTMMIMLGERR
jgi:hypothetical protein